MTESKIGMDEETVNSEATHRRRPSQNHYYDEIPSPPCDMSTVPQPYHNMPINQPQIPIQTNVTYRPPISCCLSFFVIITLMALVIVCVFNVFCFENINVCRCNCTTNANNTVIESSSVSLTH